MAEYISKQQIVNVLLNIESSHNFIMFGNSNMNPDSLDNIIKNMVEQAITEGNRQLLREIQSEILDLEGRELCLLCKENPED